MVGLRPQTPGTFVVLAATVLLVIVSVSVPVWKKIYLLSADIGGSAGGQSFSGGTLYLGVWGYCLNDVCSNASLGYDLSAADNIFSLLGFQDFGQAAGISNSVIKGLTYVLILHPVAAGLAALATLIGLISHLHEFSRGACTAFVASLAGTVALLAFVFDIVCFTIAKNRINASQYGSNATLGNAVWLTLAAMVLLIVSGVFFCIGGCIVRKRSPGRQASDMAKPVPDSNYASQMRYDAAHAYNTPFVAAGDRVPERDYTRNGSLPVFYDKDGEVLPLRSYPDASDEEQGYHSPSRNALMPPRENSMAGSHISGVGMGYGRREDTPVSPISTSSHGGHPYPTSPYDTSAPMTPLVAGAGAAGAGSRLAQEARDRRGYGPSTVEPFTSMSPPPQQQQQPYGSGSAYPESPRHDFQSHDYAAQPYQDNGNGNGNQFAAYGAGAVHQPSPVRPYEDLKREHYPDLGNEVQPSTTPAPSYTTHPNNAPLSSSSAQYYQPQGQPQTSSYQPQQAQGSYGDEGLYGAAQPQQERYSGHANQSSYY